MLRGRPEEMKALVAGIRAHLHELGRIVEDASAFRWRTRRREPLALRVLGSMLQDFYTGVEAIVELMAQACEQARGGFPAPGVADGDLPFPAPVFSQELLEALEEYRAFRQIFRSVYGHRLNPRRMELLLNDLPRVYRQFREEVEAFVAALGPGWRGPPQDDWAVARDDGGSLVVDPAVTDPGKRPRNGKPPLQLHPHHPAVKGRRCFPEVPPGSMAGSGGSLPLA